LLLEQKINFENIRKIVDSAAYLYESGNEKEAKQILALLVSELKGLK